MCAVPTEPCVSLDPAVALDEAASHTYSIRMKKKLTITVDEAVYAGLHPKLSPADMENVDRAVLTQLGLG